MGKTEENVEKRTKIIILNDKSDRRVMFLRRLPTRVALDNVSMCGL